MWCEDEERSIPLQVERKVKVNTQGKDLCLVCLLSVYIYIYIYIYLYIYIYISVYIYIYIYIYLYKCGRGAYLGIKCSMLW